MKPVIHMHVPKTGGTYINFVFTQALGSERSLCHCSDELSLVNELVKGGRFFSAHLPLQDFMSRLPGNSGEYFFLASFRDPVEQLASHIRWLDHYSQAGFESEFAALPKDIQLEITLIGETDFNDPKSLLSYLTSLSPVGTSLFNNVQTRYLSRSVEEDFYSHIQEKDLRLAIKNVDLLDFILLQNCLESDIATLSKVLEIQLPKAEPQNISISLRPIETKNAEIVNSLKSCLKFDFALYQHLQLRRDHQLIACE